MMYCVLIYWYKSKSINLISSFFVDRTKFYCLLKEKVACVSVYGTVTGEFMFDT